ncbi:hypothetical protein ACIP6P_10610 [Streptomyces sp. NPDC088729]|uniref:hypothetical protein n=1 Tax=Streptomyces sp. NPDC088729 TaxID=3365876 RepID=UPI0038251FE5
MDTQQNNPYPLTLAEVSGPLPSSGVIHVVIPHTSRFTIVGNHLAQHRTLSLTALALAVHIQSLPSGAKVGVKALAARFTEGETRIAAALRELEAHGYLRRTRTRAASGRIITRTVFCNQPEALPRTPSPARPAAPAVAADGTRDEARPEAEAAPPAPPGAAPPEPEPAPEAEPEAKAAPAPAPEAAPPAPPEAEPAPEPVPRSAQPPASRSSRPPAARPELPPRDRTDRPSAVDAAQAPPPYRAPVLVPPPTAPKPPPPALPRPRELTADLHRAAAELLADLRRHVPQLVLSAPDIDLLAPAVAAWLERDVHPDTIRRALSDDLPQPLKHPAKLLRHRIVALLPPPLPATGGPLPVHRAPAVPFQTCDGCERAFRATGPGHCRDCRTRLPQVA